MSSTRVESGTCSRTICNLLYSNFDPPEYNTYIIIEILEILRTERTKKHHKNHKNSSETGEKSLLKLRVYTPYMLCMLST